MPAYLLLILAPLFWAGNVVLARGVVTFFPPIALAFWRWTLAFLFILPFTWRAVVADWPLVRQNWRPLALLGFLGISCFNTLLYVGVQTTTAINGALIQTTMPALIILISWGLYGERVRPLHWLGVALCTAGALLIVVRGDWQVLVSLSLVTGDALILLAVFLYGLYSVLLRKRPPLRPASFLATTFGMGVLLLLPFYMWELATNPMPATFNLQAISALLYMAIGPSILAYICWNRGIELLGASKGGLFINFVPLFAAVLSILFLGEHLQWFHPAGMALIVGGMLVFQVKGGKAGAQRGGGAEERLTS